MNNKKWKITCSKEFMKKSNELPDDVYEELTNVIQGFKSGKLDPEKIGTPIVFVELKIKLVCPECKSKDVEWLLDKNSDEVTFHCLKCSESFWMTHDEYKSAIKKNFDCII